MRTNAIASLLASELIGRVETDQSAETVMEIAKATGRSRSYVGELVKIRCENGDLEKVLKKVGNNTVPAYRVKNKYAKKS
jgi:hypothetical protein